MNKLMSNSIALESGKDIFLVESEIEDLDSEIRSSMESIDNGSIAAERIYKRICLNEEILENGNINDSLVKIAIENHYDDMEFIGLSASSLSVESLNDKDALTVSIEADKNLLEKIWDAIKKFFSKLWNALKNFVNKILELIGLKDKKSRELVEKVEELPKDVKLDKISDELKNMLIDKFGINILDGWDISNINDIISSTEKKYDYIKKGLGRAFMAALLKDMKDNSKVVWSVLKESTLKNFTGYSDISEGMFNGKKKPVRSVMVFDYIDKTTCVVVNYAPNANEQHSLGGWKYFDLKLETNTKIELKPFKQVNKDDLEKLAKFCVSIKTKVLLVKDNIKTFEKAIEGFQKSMEHKTDNMIDYKPNEINAFIRSLNGAGTKVIAEMARTYKKDVDNLDWLASKFYSEIQKIK